jgi:CheY-like chemotaxis protein
VTKQTLLLVDSDARSMRMLEVSLRKAGYEVLTTRTGVEALAAVEEKTPDLILSDTHLLTPEGDLSNTVSPRDGYELCERLKQNERWSRVPFIFLTGDDSLDDKIRGLKLGVEDYLTKPIYLKELLARVQLVLARKRHDSLKAVSSRANFLGELASMGLVDLLTTIDLGRKSGVIEITGIEGNGSLTFHEGKVTHAHTGTRRGEAAVYRMLRWAEGRFEAQFGPLVLVVSDAPNVHLPTQNLLMEGLRRADEWNHLEDSLGPLGVPWEIDRDEAARHEKNLDETCRTIIKCLSHGSLSLLTVIDQCQDDLSALSSVMILRKAGIAKPVGDTNTLWHPAKSQRVSEPTRPTEPYGSLDEVVDAALTAMGESAPEIASASNAVVTTGIETAKTTEQLAQRPTHTSSKHQERHVGKQKGKRQKGKQDVEQKPASMAVGTGSQPVQAAVPSQTSPAVARVETNDKGLRVEGNVIHFPVSAETARTVAKGSDAVAQTASKIEEAVTDTASHPSDISSLRSPEGERERTTVPPEEKKVEAKTDEKKVEAKTDDKKAKIDITLPRKDDPKRSHKESLSTHLTEEARAFFSEQAYQAAYKKDHDTFEDLVPATEEHPHEAARSRQSMTVLGGILVLLTCLVVGGVFYREKYAVHETTLAAGTLATRPEDPIVSPEAQHAAETQAPVAPVAPEPTPTPAPAVVEPAPVAPSTPTAATPATAEPAVVAPTPVPVPAEPAVVAPTPTPAPAPTPAPVVAPAPAPVAPAVTGQTPAQMLAAARSFRGPMAGRIAAYTAYFDAAPQDDRAMTNFAMSLAEMNRTADAATIAQRAVTANERNAQAWFVLAFARHAQHDAAGSREARARCIALGGQWASECRAIQ